MVGVASENALQVALVHDQEVVETLGTDPPHKPFRVSIRIGRPEGRREDFGTPTGEHLVEPEGRQKYDRVPELALPGELGHHRPWPSPSSTSASTGSLGSSSPGGGPSRTRSSRSWCSATRCASSNASSTDVSATGPPTGRCSQLSVDCSLGPVGRPSSSPPTPWCAGTGNWPGVGGDDGEHNEGRGDRRCAMNSSN